MKLSGITEGIVSTSRGRIVNVKNDLADTLAQMIRAMGFPEPDVEYADSAVEDAILYVDISGSTLMIRIISDDDIQIQVPEALSQALQISDYIKLGNPGRVKSVLRKVKAALP